MTSFFQKSNNLNRPIEVNTGDLPLFCPDIKFPIWNLHPRVFLEINHMGLAKCPYCGTVFFLKNK